jgi:membrane-bound lytic murein transglycosylase D
MNVVRMMRFLLVAVFFIWNSNINAQITDNPIAAMLDSLSNKKMLEYALSKPAYPKVNKFHYAHDSVPSFDDNVYEARCAKMDAVSPFDLQFNQEVKPYIDLYTKRKRESVQRMMGISQLYYPIFEEILDKYNLPLELKHLAVIESALNPTAKSPAGAMGLWQFMYSTGKMYNLKINSYLDERCDPYKATVAAAECLRDLYKMFKDWQMVLAAYNAGPGTVSKAIRRSGGKKTYWEIRPFLPRETQAYVPAFIAANYVMTYTAEHNLYSANPKKSHFEVDSVNLREPLTFNQIAEVLDVTVDEIAYFNPMYRKNLVPGGGYTLTLPKNKIGKFISNEEEIYAMIRTNEERKKVVAEINTPKLVPVYHVVTKYDKLGTIAKRYGVTIASIKSWNYINPRRGIRPGTKLVIYKSEKTDTDVNPESDVNSGKDNQTVTNVAENKKETSVTTDKKKKAEKTVIVYTVRRGDNLYKIAKNNGVTVDQLKRANGINEKSKLYYGMKLKIVKG